MNIIYIYIYYIKQYTYVLKYSLIYFYIYYSTTSFLESNVAMLFYVILQKVHFSYQTGAWFNWD